MIEHCRPIQHNFKQQNGDDRRAQQQDQCHLDQHGKNDLDGVKAQRGSEVETGIGMMQSVQPPPDGQQVDVAPTHTAPPATPPESGPQVQRPAMQVSPAPQLTPHMPQLFSSVPPLAQPSPGQQVGVAPAQTGPPPTTPLSPAHRQRPPTQTSFVPQATSQPPQWRASVSVSTQLVPQSTETLPPATHTNLYLVGGKKFLVVDTGSEEVEENERLLSVIARRRALGQEPVGISAPILPLEETKEHPGGGSTDAGDVSYVVPTIRLSASIAHKDTPWHSWAVVAYGGMSIGHKGMAYAAKALSMTMVDLFEDPELRRAVRAEYLERKGDYVYEGIVPEGPPPIDSDL